MNKLLILFFATFCNTFLAQSVAKQSPTREETQQWIKEKINAYSYESFDGIRNNYYIIFEDSCMVIKNKNEMDGMVVNEYTRITIIDIDFISIKEKPNNIWLTIRLKDGKKESKLFNGTVIEPNGQVEILLNSSFKENNLPERVKKAFAKLIEDYGGKPINGAEPY